MGAEVSTPTQLTFREAFEYAMSYVPSSDRNTPAHVALINGVTLLFDARNPLTITYRFQHNGQDVSLHCDIALAGASYGRYIRQAEEILATAYEADLPEPMRYLLVEHSELVKDQARFQPVREHLN